METYNTMTSLGNILKIFSLQNVSYKNRFIVNPVPYFKVILMLFFLGFLILFNVYLFFKAINHNFKSEMSISVAVTSFAIFVLIYSSYIVDLYFVYKYGSEMRAYFNIYGQMDTVVFMKYNQEIRQKVFALLASFLSVWFLTFLAQYVTWGYMYGWISSGAYTSEIFFLFVKSLTLMDLSTQIMQIKYRLKTILDQIKEFASLADDSVNRIQTERIRVTDRRVQNRRKIAPFFYKRQSDLTKLNSYYLLLVEQTRFLNKIFGVRIILTCVSLILEMITIVNLIAKTLRGAVLPLSMIMSAATTCMQFLYCAAVLAALVYHCETCFRQCEDIVDAIDQVAVNKITSEAVESSLATLRNLVTSRPLRLHLAGLFSLDCTFLLSTASVVITYAVILVQNAQ